MHPLAVNIHDQPHILGHMLGYMDLGEHHSNLIKKVFWEDEDVWEQDHRGSYKTTAVSVVGPIAYHLFKPEDSILLTRKTYTNSCDTLDEMAGHYRGPVIRQLYQKVRKIPNFKLAVDRTGRITLPTKLKPSKEGSVDCAGIKSPVTGSHYKKQLNDDVSTVLDRLSRAERMKTRSYIEEQKNIRNPGGSIATIGTMWHKEDIFHVETPTGWREVPGLVKRAVGTIPIRGFTPQYIAKLQSEMTPALFAANYLLTLVADDDRKFSDPVYVKWPEEVETQGWLDPAYEGDCTTALTLLGNWRHQWYGVGFVWNKDATEMGHEIAEVLKKWNCGTCYVEDNADRGYAAAELSKYHAAVERKNEKDNKHIKIVTHAVAHWKKIKWANFESCSDEEYLAYMAQVLDYREKELPNDAPDSLASLCRELDMDDPDGNDMVNSYA